MIAKLTYNLPEEAQEFRRASNATEAYAALWDLSTEIDALKKSTLDEATALQVVEKFSELFYEILLDHGIDFNRDYI